MIVILQKTEKCRVWKRYHHPLEGLILLGICPLVGGANWWAVIKQLTHRRHLLLKSSRLQRYYMVQL